MNAVSLYVSTCRLVLQARTNDSVSWTELNRLLPLLRTALSCSVCSQLLTDPMSPEEWTSSSEMVCRECVTSCKDSNCKYVENARFRILLLCFKKLCEYIVTASYSRKLEPDNNCAASLANILLESFNGMNVTNSEDELTDANGDLQDPRDKTEHYDGVMFTNNNGDSRDSHYSVMFANSHHTKITIKRKSIDSPSQSDSNPCPSDVESVFKRTKSPAAGSGGGCKTRYNRPKVVTKKGCRCGNATPTPGKLTCCGQRCPCYVNGKGCVECRCKGCRNPHKPMGCGGENGSDRGNNINNSSSNSVYFSNDDDIKVS